MSTKATKDTPAATPERSADIAAADRVLADLRDLLAALAPEPTGEGELDDTEPALVLTISPDGVTVEHDGNVRRGRSLRSVVLDLVMEAKRKAEVLSRW